MAIAVRVRRKHIRSGRAGDCFRCAVAQALHDATGDDHANVYESDWQLWLEVWGRHTVAPVAVRAFVDAIDGQDRDRATGLPILPRKLREELAPFSFEMPDIDDPEWQERCYGCEKPFSPKELDEEQYCEECRE